ncbi:MAG TPA: ABC transporter ATP-binding protein, partial [Acholeplasma sp.]|nr:ABC transporter ATP-binding protein [Acholeplasma sp.]
MLKLKNIKKDYKVANGKVEALKGITLSFRKNEFVSVLGPSGCGKTTLLRMIAGLNSITEGDIFFNDKRINTVPPKDRDIAMVFQSYALYPHMTVYEN